MRIHRILLWAGILMACTPNRKPRGEVEHADKPPTPSNPVQNSDNPGPEPESNPTASPTPSPPPAIKVLKFGSQSCEKNAATGACYAVDPSLNEMSGIVASPGGQVFWVHNDEGPGIIYAINLRGEILSRQNLTGINFLDSEDITLGPGPKVGVSYLYVGDIGDGGGTAGVVRVVRFPEPAVDPNQKGVNGTPADVVSFTLTYPGKLQDFETLFIDPIEGDLFLVQKGGYNVYKASKAMLDAVANGGSVALSLVRTTGSWAMEPSSGNMSPSGDEIVLRNETTAWIFRRAAGQKVEDALNTIALTLTLGPEFNGEAITFDAKGQDLLTVSENTTKGAPAPSPPQPVSVYKRLP